MRNHITISDIRKRSAILNESTESSDTRNISNAYELAARTDRFEDIRNFIKECGSSRYNASEYIKPCIEFLEKSNNIELDSIFEYSVLPRVNDFELNYNLESTNETVQTLIKNQIIKNKVIDRLLENHAYIMEKYNIESLLEQGNVGLYENYSIYKLCSTIDKFELPPYAKVNIALEEGSYLLQMYKSGEYNEKIDLVDPVVEYFSIALPLTEQDKRKINKVVYENYLLESEYAELLHDTDSKSVIQATINTYKNRSDHNPVEVATITKNIMEAPYTDWSKNIHLYFDLLTKIICFGHIEEDKKFIIDNVLPTFYNDFERRMGMCMYLKNLINKVIKSIDEEIMKCYKYTDIDYVEEYISALKKLINQFYDMNDITYSAENVQYMTQTPILETINRVTLYEYKFEYKEGLLVKGYLLDKYVQKQIRQWAADKKQKLQSVFKDLDERIHEQSTFLEDYITPEGNVDLLVCSYMISDANDPNYIDWDEVHAECDNLICRFNKDSLTDTHYSAYYEAESDRVNFYIKDHTNIILSEDEQLLINEKITEEFQDRLSELLFISESIDPEFNLVESAVEFFETEGNEVYFKEFCDLCSVAGVDRETLEEIYDSVAYDIPTFKINNSYVKESYKEDEADIIACTEATMILQAMLEDTKKVPTKSLTSGTNNKKPNGTRTKVSPTVKTSKMTSTIKTSKESPTSKLTDVKDKVKGSGNPFKGINLNNLKLYAAGLKKGAKDLDNKAKSSVRDMDFMVERLVKSIKQALISDRREAIIKGSVIPSFHKCILIAVGLAGLAWFNAPLAIITAIGGFAASKSLTKKERALMMDDIEIELELLEKEIQMADNRNQIKKMRQLMKMKKTLQREYQRIKYNIRIGKDIVPSNSYLPDNISGGGR